MCCLVLLVCDGVNTKLCFISTCVDDQSGVLIVFVLIVLVMVYVVHQQDLHSSWTFVDRECLSCMYCRLFQQCIRDESFRYQ